MANFFKQCAQMLTLAVLLVSPFVVDYNALPWGYETPKGTFVMLMAALVIIFSLLSMLFYPKKTLPARRKLLSPVIVIVGWLVFTTLQAHNRDMAIWGNEYRRQGLLFNLAMIGLWLVLPHILSQSFYKIILYVFVIIGLIQAVIAISQAINLLTNYTVDDLTSGFYVNGTFGQSEFFAGQILLTIPIALLVARLIATKFKRVSKLIYVIIAVALLALLLSFSLAAWGTLALGVLIFAYPYLSKKIGRKNNKVIYTLVFVALSALFIGWLAHDFRSVIWNEAIKIITTQAPLWGFGLDNQQYVFVGIKNLIVERGHNLIIDIIVTIGWGGLCLLIIFFWTRMQQFYQQLRNEDNFNRRLIIITLFMLLFRLLVHTTSAVNIVELVVVAVLWEYMDLLTKEKGGTTLGSTAV